MCISNFNLTNRCREYENRKEIGDLNHSITRVNPLNLGFHEVFFYLYKLNHYEIFYLAFRDPDHKITLGTS